MYSISKIRFFFEGSKVNLKSRVGLKRFIEYIITKEGRSIDYINCIFCSDKKILAINRRYLSHNFYTDIVTFDLSESKVIQAEIYISVDRIKENAQKLGVSIKSELHRVIFHGVLHLCGYQDKTKMKRKIMRGKEDFYLFEYFTNIPRGTVSI